MMTPDVSVHRPVSRNDRQWEAEPPLSALLILPVPKTESKKDSIWMRFLQDLAILLPIFGTLLGYMLLAGQAPISGAILVTICPIALLVRLHNAYLLRRERMQVAALERWYRSYRAEYENIWKKEPGTGA